MEAFFFSPTKLWISIYWAGSSKRDAFLPAGQNAGEGMEPALPNKYLSTVWHPKKERTHGFGLSSPVLSSVLSSVFLLSRSANLDHFDLSLVAQKSAAPNSICPREFSSS